MNTWVGRRPAVYMSAAEQDRWHRMLRQLQATRWLLANGHDDLVAVLGLTEWRDRLVRAGVA